MKTADPVEVSARAEYIQWVRDRAELNARQYRGPVSGAPNPEGKFVVRFEELNGVRAWSVYPPLGSRVRFLTPDPAFSFLEKKLADQFRHFEAASFFKSWA